MRIRIKDIREAAGISQRELAQRASLSQTYVSQLESGARSLKPATMEVIAGILGVSPGDLIDWDAPAQDEVDEIVAIYLDMTPTERRRARAFMHAHRDDAQDDPESAAHPPASK